MKLGSGMGHDSNSRKLQKKEEELLNSFYNWLSKLMPNLYRMVLNPLIDVCQPRVKSLQNGLNQDNYEHEVRTIGG